MIIGINGKIGSGKDTVGSIIQYLVYENKKYLYSYDKFIKEPKSYQEGTSGWEIKKFAYKLKQIVSLLTGCTIEDLESQEFKNKQLPAEWDYVAKWIAGDTGISGNYPKSVETYQNDEIFKANPNRFIKHYTYRDLLQKIGTNAMRDMIHENVWVNSLMVDYKPKYWNIIKERYQEIGNFTYYQSGVDKTTEAVVEHFPNWIITDMRFPNELNTVEDRGGITIRVRRTQWLKKGTEKTHEHPSETALDLVPFKYVIDNDGTIEELVEKVREILIKEKVI